MKIKYIDFELDGYSIFATGEYHEDSRTIENINYECDREVDEEMDTLILGCAEDLLLDQIDSYDELNF